MAKKIPVTSWIARQRPNIDPKFQKWLILDGAGRSIRVEFKIFTRGIFFRRFISNSFVWVVFLLKDLYILLCIIWI